MRFLDGLVKEGKMVKTLIEIIYLLVLPAIPFLAKTFDISLGKGIDMLAMTIIVVIWILCLPIVFPPRKENG